LRVSADDGWKGMHLNSERGATGRCRPS